MGSPHVQFKISGMSWPCSAFSAADCRRGRAGRPIGSWRPASTHPCGGAVPAREVPSARNSWSLLVSPPLWSRARLWNAGAASHRTVASRLLDVDEIDGAGTGRSSGLFLGASLRHQGLERRPLGLAPGYNRTQAVKRPHLDHTLTGGPEQRHGPVLAGAAGPGIILAGYSDRPPEKADGLLSARQN